LSRVRWTQPAARDLTNITNICDYIKEHESAESARRVALVFLKAVSSLDRFPNRACPGRKAGIRELVLQGSRDRQFGEIAESVVYLIN
jgi:plasmid stabilization system protein ParE